MNVDLIVKNANVHTVDNKNPCASAFAIKDGRFVFVGDEAGLAGFEGKTIDAQGKFIMPGLIDSHAHISCSLPMCQFKYPLIDKRGKKAMLEEVAKKVKADAGQKAHFFMVRELYFQGEEITKEDLDAISTTEGIYLLEFEPHCGWCNSKMLEMLGIEEDTPDPCPGYTYLVRDSEGKLTGRIYEGFSSEAIFANTEALSDDYIKSEIKRLDAYCKRIGITTITECAMPCALEFGERVYSLFAELDRAGEISLNVNGAYGTQLPKYLPGIVDELKRYNKKFNTEHLHVRTLKLLIDGTSAISTAYMLKPRYDNGLSGGKLCSEETLAGLIKQCDEFGFDVHLHVIGDGAIRMSLDAVEDVRNQLGRPLNSIITLTHVELCSDEDVPRFKELDVIANFTPYWMSPPEISGGYEHMQKALGERFRYEYRVKDIMDAGATVTFGCDQIGMDDVFMNWTPFLGMEVGVLRRYTPKTLNADYSGATDYALTPEQSVTLEDMIKGYTINGAKQLGDEANRGSIEEGKIADFLVLPEDILARDVEGISHIEPDEVYFKGVKVH